MTSFLFHIDCSVIDLINIVNLSDSPDLPPLSFSVCPASSTAAPARRNQAAAGGEAKQEGGGQNRKSSPAEAGSPLLGNANNPNVSDIPDRRNTSATPPVSTHPIIE